MLLIPKHCPLVGDRDLCATGHERINFPYAISSTKLVGLPVLLFNERSDELEV